MRSRPVELVESTGEWHPADPGLPGHRRIRARVKEAEQGSDSSATLRAGIVRSNARAMTIRLQSLPQKETLYKIEPG